MQVDLVSALRLNSASADTAFRTISRSCKYAIQVGDATGEKYLRLAAAVALGSKAEAMLLSLLHDPAGLALPARTRVLAGRSQKELWQRALTEAFAARYGLAHSQIPSKLDFTARARYSEMSSLIVDQLDPLIQLRNNVAHGQWARALTSDGSKINPDSTAALHRTTLWELQILNNLIDHLILLLRDALITQTAFERDFDHHYRNIHSARVRLRVGSHEKWRQQLQGRHERGAPWKRSGGPKVSRLTSDRLFSSLSRARSLLMSLRSGVQPDSDQSLEAVAGIDLATANLHYDLTGESTPTSDEMWEWIGRASDKSHDGRARFSDEA